MDKFRCCVRLFIAHYLALAGAAVHADDWFYTIKPGDTLWQVCADYVAGPESQCIGKLQTYNTQIKDNLKLPPGMQISIPVALLKYPPQPATVEFTQGDAYLVLPTAAHREVLTAGTTLSIDSKVITENGSVLLRFADQSTLLLKPHSEIVMDRLSAHREHGMVDTLLNLKRGNATIKVKRKTPESRFRIKTPAAVAAVRGTEFRVSSDPAANDTMRTETLSGVVAVTAQAEEKSVNKGFGTLVAAGEPPLAPRELLTAPSLSVPAALSLPYTLSWSQLNGAANYMLDIFKGDSTDNLLQSLLLDGTNHTLASLDDGVYTLSLRGIDTIGLQGLDAIVSFIKENLLPAPRIDAGAINPTTNELHISWPPVTGAQSYKIEVGGDEQFDQLIYSTVVDTPAVNAPLLTRHHYFVRAQTIDRHGRLSEPSPAVRWTNQVIELWLALGLVIAALLLVLRFR